MDTEEKLKLARSGDDGAAEAILQEFSRMVNMLAKNLAAPDDVQDMAQIGLMAVAAAIKDYDETKGAKFFTYAYMCAQRRMIDQARKNSRRLKTVGFGEVPEPQYRPNFDQALIAEELLSKMAEVLSDLELKSLMLQTENMSYGEIAARLKVTEKTVDNAVSRARKKLKALSN